MRLARRLSISSMFELDPVRVKDSPRRYPLASEDPVDVELILPKSDKGQKVRHVTIVCPHAWPSHWQVSSVNP
jgi:hypothetical protein